MTLAQQALHLFNKDVRQLRLEVGALLALAAFLVWYWTDSWSGETNGDLIELRTGQITGPYVAAVWFLMIARLLHTDPLVGDRQFWLTRPYSRSALLLAKSLFAAAFLLAPLLIAQALAVILSGLPLSLGALLVNQLAIAALVCLPAAAVAALTRNLWQYVPLMALGGLAAAAAWAANNGTLNGPVPYIAGTVLLGGISAGLLLAQFGGRRTVRNATAYFSACAAVWLIVVAFPRDLARASESVLDGATTLGPVSFGIGPLSPLIVEPSPFPYLPRSPMQRSLRLPIEVTGADFRDLVLIDPTVTVRTPTGGKLRLAATLWRGSSSYSLLAYAHMLGPLSLAAIPDQLMNEPVSVHVELWVKRFDTVASATLPADGSAMILDGREQCRAIRPGDSLSPIAEPRPIVMCRQALAVAPWRELQVLPVPNRMTNSSAPVFSRIVIPTFDPIKHTRIQAYWLRSNEDQSDVPAILLLRERDAFVRVTFEVENVRLADYVEQ